MPPKSSYDLENEVKFIKTLSALKLVPMRHPGKFGGIPSTGSRDIMGTRIRHADAEMTWTPTTTGSALKPIFPFTFVGGT